MWTNEDDFTLLKKEASGTFLSRSKWHDNDFPVAVIPLDDIQGLIDRAAGAHYHAVQAHPYHTMTIGAMRSAFESIGILPKQRKTKGRK